MLISDHINLQGANPLIGPNDEALGARFPDMTEAYSKAYRAIARKVAQENGITLHEGVYAALSGPNYETPAEIRAFHGQTRGMQARWLAKHLVPRGVIEGLRRLGGRTMAAPPFLDLGRLHARAGSPHANSVDLRDPVRSLSIAQLTSVMPGALGRATLPMLAPPTMIMAICTVKGIRLQKPCPK